MIEKVVDINPGSVTPLHLAARNGHLELCQFIMEKVEDQNPKAPRCGTTPLHLAAIKGHLNVCHYILGKVSDLNPKDANGPTPFFKATLYGYLTHVSL